MSRLFTCALLLAAACGSQKPAPAAPAPANTAQAQPDMHQMMAKMDAEMANLPPSVRAFHDAFAPQWHAPQGPQRMQGTCAAVPELRGDLTPIINAPPPAGADAQAWKTSTLQLITSLEALDAACKVHDATAFEAVFAKVHDAFHAVLSAGGVHMDMGREGMEHAQATLERALLEPEHDRAELRDEGAPAMREVTADDDGDGAGK